MYSDRKLVLHLRRNWQCRVVPLLFLFVVCMASLSFASSKCHNPLHPMVQFGNSVKQVGVENAYDISLADNCLRNLPLASTVEQIDSCFRTLERHLTVDVPVDWRLRVVAELIRDNDALVQRYYKRYVSSEYVEYLPPPYDLYLLNDASGTLVTLATRSSNRSSITLRVSPDVAMSPVVPGNIEPVILSHLPSNRFIYTSVIQRLVDGYTTLSTPCVDVSFDELGGTYVVYDSKSGGAMLTRVGSTGGTMWINPLPSLIASCIGYSHCACYVVSSRKYVVLYRATPSGCHVDFLNATDGKLISHIRVAKDAENNQSELNQ